MTPETRRRMLDIQNKLRQVELMLEEVPKLLTDLRLDLDALNICWSTNEAPEDAASWLRQSQFDREESELSPAERESP